jgi:antitoxin StbD
MAIPHLVVQPTSVARSQLSSALAHFRQDGVNAEPLVFGSHRQPEGVVIPFELFKAIYPAIEDAQTAALLRERIADDRPRTTLEGVIDELGFDSSDFTLG